jgi:hypothetical protein
MLYQYPSTYHLPWSENIIREDKVLTNTAHFQGQNVIPNYFVTSFPNFQLFLWQTFFPFLFGQ